MEDILAGHVRDGRVDYDSIDGLDAALEAVANAKRGRGDADYAFLLNAYNISTLDAVRRRLYRDNQRIGSLRNPFTWMRFFLATPVTVAGKRMSLYALEARELKPYLRRDPRGHFALVCASLGCPPLRDGLYHADTLDAELRLAGQSFMVDALDRSAGVLRLSRIMKWYAKDFDRRGGALAVYLEHAPADDAAWVRANRPRIVHPRYDWDLNIAK